MIAGAEPGPLCILLLVVSAFTTSCASPPERSRTQRDAFQRANPCPANGATRGPCPGYVVDHIEPLCAGGADAPANMQWQTVPDGKLKDRHEVHDCRAKK